MGVMNYQEFVNELRYNIDNRETQDIPDTQLARYINWAYYHVCEPKLYRHPALQALQAIPLIANDRDYNLNVDVGEIRSVYNVNDGYKLIPRDIRWLDARPPNFGGRPGVYIRENNVLFVHNGPTTSDAGKVLNVRYWKIPTPLVAGQTTILTPIWDEIIVMGAAWRTWRTLNRPDHAEIAKQDFGQMVNEVTSVEMIEGEDWDAGTQPLTPLYMSR